MKKLVLIFFVAFNFAHANENKVVFSGSTIPYIDVYEKLSVKNSFNNELTRSFKHITVQLKRKKEYESFLGKLVLEFHIIK